MLKGTTWSCSISRVFICRTYTTPSVRHRGGQHRNHHECFYWYCIRACWCLTQTTAAEEAMVGDVTASASTVGFETRQESNSGAMATRMRRESPEVKLVKYEDERQLDDIMSLVDRDLSEPYSIFTYRYFLHNWPNLCFVVSSPVGMAISLVSGFWLNLIE